MEHVERTLALADLQLEGAALLGVDDGHEHAEPKWEVASRLVVIAATLFGYVEFIFREISPGTSLAADPLAARAVESPVERRRKEVGSLPAFRARR
jgi:hypothetical protein